MNDIIGKTVESIEDVTCNFKVIHFTDGSRLELEIGCVSSVANLYGIETNFKNK